MICSASQSHSFWNPVVLSKLCESSMRAIVIAPPRCGVPSFVAGEPPLLFDDESLGFEEPPQPAIAGRCCGVRGATAARDCHSRGESDESCRSENAHVPSSGGRLALNLRSVYNTQAQMSRPTDLLSDPVLPAGHKPLSRTVADWLAQRIISGETPPGQRLTEPGVAELAGVSRSPVREALRILASEGLV